jgi:hypothetical protein
MAASLFTEVSRSSPAQTPAVGTAAKKERAVISEIYLHVHVAAEDAIRFYRHHGFEVEREEKNYYAKLSPPDAFVMRKKIVPSSAASESGAAATAQ